MPISFTSPATLLALPILIGTAVGLHVLARGGFGEARARIALVIRGLIITALVLSLAGAGVTLPTDRLATVFVVDLSNSIGNAGRQDALAFVRDALTRRPEGDLAGVVAFGKDALVERLPDELAGLDRIASTPVRTATDVGAALRLAAALFPDDAQKRIVLLSDGNDTTGAGQVEAARAAARGVTVDTRAIGLGNADEVLVEHLAVPSTSHLGETLSIVADVRSTVAQPAAVRLFADGALVETKRVQLAAGMTQVTFEVTPKEAGFHAYRATVEAGRDTFVENNRADGDTLVSGPPRVLVVAPESDVATDLVTALKSREGTVTQMVPEQVPEDVATLIGYDSIVLVNVPRPRFTSKQLEAIRTVVRDYGKGLVMIGGDESFGAGGYRDTPMESALPVEMRVRSKEKQPDIALVVVIDESGSMAACHCNSFDRSHGATQLSGVQKVDIGKEAILRAAAAMTSRDELGVVAFNEAAHWVVHTTPLGNVGDLQGNLGAIRADGQTNILSGLDEAVKSLEQTTATRRHLILLTDGWSTSGQYDAILARMKAAGITLSTVGAGGGANPFLQELATRGGGRFYAATDPTTIPDIFLKETQQVAGQQIVEETFFPTITGSSPILRGMDTGLPSLLGYDGTTIKAAAQQVLASARGDPVLAQWQYGLGRAVAWTPDATSRWARNWVGWSGFTRFFGQLVSWTFPGEESGGIEARFVAGTGGTTLRVESVGPDGSPRDFYATSVTMVDPAYESRQVDLAQVAPGVYEASLGELTPGAYAVRVTQTRAGAAAVGRNLGLVAPSPAEYRLLGTNEPLLAALRSSTGGAVVATAGDAWRHDLGTTTRDTPMWPWLLILAALLWPLDVFLRRVALGRRDVAAGARWVREIPARRTRVAVRGAPATAMLAARGRAGGGGARAALAAARPAEGEGPGSDVAGSPATSTGAEASAAPAAPLAPRPPAPSVARTASAQPAPEPSKPAVAPPKPAPAHPAAEPSKREPAADDTLARLREARRRARR